MRICFISFSVYGYFNPDMYSRTGAGGAQRQLYLFTTRSSDEHDIHFVVGDYGQSQIEVYDGVTLHKTFRPTGSTLKKPIELYKILFTMKKLDADIYVSRYAPKKSVIFYLLTKLIGKKFVLNIANDKSVQNLQRFPSVFRKIYVEMLKNVDGLIVQTQYQQRRLRELAGVEATIVPNGYTTTDARPEHGDRHYFLWVGRLHVEQKRPHLFVKLAEKNPSIDFYLIGTRGTEQYRKSLVQEMSSIDNLDYQFDVSPDKIQYYYERAIALVNTSAYEGFPNTFLEAWRVGTPVLSLSVDPERFLEQDETTDFQAGDIETLSELVREFNANKESWERVSCTVKHRFEKKYSIDEVADRYAEVIENTVR